MFFLRTVLCNKMGCMHPEKITPKPGTSGSGGGRGGSIIRSAGWRASSSNTAARTHWPQRSRASTTGVGLALGIVRIIKNTKLQVPVWRSKPRAVLGWSIPIARASLPPLLYSQRQKVPKSAKSKHIPFTIYLMSPCLAALRFPFAPCTFCTAARYWRGRWFLAILPIVRSWSTCAQQIINWPPRTQTKNQTCSSVAASHEAAVVAFILSVPASTAAVYVKAASPSAVLLLFCRAISNSNSRSWGLTATYPAHTAQLG